EADFRTLCEYIKDKARAHKVYNVVTNTALSAAGNLQEELLEQPDHGWSFNILMEDVRLNCPVLAGIKDTITDEFIAQHSKSRSRASKKLLEDAKELKSWFKKVCTYNVKKVKDQLRARRVAKAHATLGRTPAKRVRLDNDGDVMEFD